MDAPKRGNGALNTRSHPDAEKRPAPGAVTEVPVDVPSLALGVNELRRWMGPRQASCRGSARPLHPLPFTSTALGRRQATFHGGFGHPRLAPGQCGRVTHLEVAKYSNNPQCCNKPSRFEGRMQRKARKALRMKALQLAAFTK